ncbi:MAG TPA: hypothetical protein VG053_04225 [Solirubrobacteraceae bacterium]|jgi:glutamine amidotransferase|nr:hypothetical protein [Solirubrobacteraceae bacterium]
MCRWLAYSGSPLLLKEALYGLANSLIEQSLHSRLGAETTNALHGVANPFQGTIATTSGEAIWAFRYSSEGKSRSLFYTTDVPTLRKLYPERELYEEVSEDARMVVSEPLGDIPGVWNEVPEATCRIVGAGHDESLPFRPRAPLAS